jgi:mycothiol synthase
MIELRTVESAADVAAWAALKSTVVPNEPVTAEQLRASDAPGRLLLLAERDGVLVGCGIGAPSSFGGRAFIAARVLPEHRRRRVGTALVRALSEHGRALGRAGVNAFVYADEPHSMAFAEGLGLREVDYQLEQVCVVGDEPPPIVPDGIELIALAGRRDELLNALWPVALQGYADMPVPGEVSYELEQWLRAEATRPGGSFAAFAGDVPVGYAGLIGHASGPATAEHGLTVVDREQRGRGIARALKQAQLHWAARNGVDRLVTWTQKGNEAMQALNRSLGYDDVSKVLTYQGPLPA